MRRGKCFVQVQVHHVHAEIAGANLAHKRVHVGAVHVEQAAFGVHDVRDLVDLLLEDAQRIGIGKHERGHVLVHLRRQRGHVHHALGVRFQILYRVADHRSRGRICAVGGIRDQNFLARRALRLVDRREPSTGPSVRRGPRPQAAA